MRVPVFILPDKGGLGGYLSGSGDVRSASTVPIAVPTQSAFLGPLATVIGNRQIAEPARLTWHLKRVADQVVGGGLHFSSYDLVFALPIFCRIVRPSPAAGTGGGSQSSHQLGLSTLVTLRGAAHLAQ